jgi:hypothetical protein
MSDSRLKWADQTESEKPRDPKAHMRPFINSAWINGLPENVIIGTEAAGLVDFSLKS